MLVQATSEATRVDNACAASFEAREATPAAKKRVGCKAGTTGSCGHCVGLMIAMRYAGQVADHTRKVSRGEQPTALCPWLAPTAGKTADVKQVAWRMIFNKVEMLGNGDIKQKRASVANTASEARALFNPFAPGDYDGIDMKKESTRQLLSTLFSSLQDAVGECCVGER